MGANKLLPVEQVAGLSTPDNAYGVFVSEARAYVAGELGGLRIVDVSTPSASREIGHLETLGPARGIRVGRLRLRRGRYVRAADSGYYQP